MIPNNVLDTIGGQGHRLYWTVKYCSDIHLYVCVYMHSKIILIYWVILTSMWPNQSGYNKEDMTLLQWAENLKEVNMVLYKRKALQRNIKLKLLCFVLKLIFQPIIIDNSLKQCCSKEPRILDSNYLNSCVRFSGTYLIIYKLYSLIGHNTTIGLLSISSIMQLVCTKVENYSKSTEHET